MELAEVTADIAPRLLAYLRARTGNAALAEDLAQDALVALVATWKRRGPPSSPDAFVFAIARRRAWRALARRAIWSPLDALRDARDPTIAADVALEQREALEAVTRALQSLPRRDREVLLLRAAGELCIADIATLTHATPAAVKTRLSRVRQRLTANLRVPSHEPTRAAT